MNTAFDSEVPGSPPSQPAILLVTAAPLELEPLIGLLDRPAALTVSGKPGVRGTIGGRAVIAVAGGMGKTNAAHTLTAVLERIPVAGVVGFGVGGGYVGGGATVGGLALASSETYADEGVQGPDGWISTEGIGIPLVDTAGLRYFNEFPIDAGVFVAATRRLTDSDAPLVVGPFVTVSCCSGTERRGEELRDRFGAVCESMEGAAMAHVCTLYGVPFLEVRGVSNLVEDRDLTKWSLPEAAAVAARGAVLLAGLFGLSAPGDLAANPPGTR